MTQKNNTKLALHDILLDITWSKISSRYFSRSSSWIYNKINGVDGNGGVGGFTESEKENLKHALNDLADRLKTAADKI